MPLTKWAYGIALISFILKIVLQSSTIIPEVSRMAFQYHNFVIGFIHLVMLGLITGFLFAFLLESTLPTLKNKMLAIGIYSFTIGFLATELILVVQGFAYYLGIGIIPNYYMLLFLFSILLPLGVLLIFLSYLNHDTKTFKTT